MGGCQNYDSFFGTSIKYGTWYLGEPKGDHTLTITHIYILHEIFLAASPTRRAWVFRLFRL